MPDIQIDSFTTTSLVVTAAMCLLAVLVAWYTVRDRIQFSQIIVGVFCYILADLLGNVFDTVAVSAGMSAVGLTYGLYIVLSVVIAREVIRYLGLRFGIQGNFDTTDAAIGFAIGFAGVYLCVCAAYYFNCYSTVREFVKNGAEAFWANAGDTAEEAQDLLVMISGQSGWQFLMTGLNRVFFLVREVALTVLLWYAMGDKGNKAWLGLIPLMHVLAMLPDGLYQAEMISNTFLKDGLTCAVSGGIAFLAARQYNAKEDLVSHFKVEKLRARRRK